MAHDQRIQQLEGVRNQIDGDVGVVDSLIAKMDRLILDMPKVAPVPKAARAQRVEAASDPLKALKSLAELRDAGLITADEYEAKKTEMLGRM